MEIRTGRNGVRYSLISYSDSLLAKGEDNDCVVRAVASAFEVSYEIAHTWVASTFNRVPRKGTRRFSSIMHSLTEAFGKSIRDLRTSSIYFGKGMYTYYKQYGKINERHMTVLTFMRDHPFGKYILVTKRHAFSLIDGVIVGTFSDPQRLRKRLESAFKIG
jgi:hypothetical protein